MPSKPNMRVARTSRRRYRRGFTLIEMIVATFLLAIGVVAAVRCVGIAARTASVSHEYSIAAMLAQRKLSQLDSQTNPAQAGDTQGDFSPGNPGFKWDMNLQSTQFQNLLQATVTITWPSGPRDRSAVFSSYAIVKDQSATATQ